MSFHSRLAFPCKRPLVSLALSALFALPACGDDGGDGTGPDAGGNADAGATLVPETYTFESRFAPGESSVAYSGQVMRQVLIGEMKNYIGRLTQEIDTQQTVPSVGETTAALEFYYRFDAGTSGQVPLTITTDPPLMQMVYDDISSSNLAGKLAGNDLMGQHADWTMNFVGWDPNDATTPEGLLLHWFDQLDTLAVERSQGTIPTDPDGVALTAVYLTPEGLDLQQLIQKFLLGALAYSQGTDDYLDNDLPDHGINVSNLQAEGNPYSALEHHWDEGYGYFGAARDYNLYTDDEIAGADGREGWSNGYHDTDDSGSIDLMSEYNFGNSQNAAKRDRGSAESAPTDYSAQVMDAFLTGRAIIAGADGELDTDAMAELVAQRDLIVDGWERAIAATVVHYINDTLRDMNTFGTQDYDFADHAKHWSELKGFALGLQFNPRSQVSAVDFAMFHDLVGDAPALPNDDANDISTYRANLISARAILAASYDFDPANIGDDNGENGW